MTRFGARTQRFVAAVWLGAVAAEVVLFLLARRFNDSWFLLVAALMVVTLLVAGELTWHWFSRPVRKRWKRHDLEEATKAEAKSLRSAQP